jgi:hypothetical protein
MWDNNEQAARKGVGIKGWYKDKAGDPQTIWSSGEHK